MKNPHAVKLGKLGGSKKSDKKTLASRLNGKKGGRPKKALSLLSPKEESKEATPEYLGYEDVKTGKFHPTPSQKGCCEACGWFNGNRFICIDPNCPCHSDNNK